MSHAACSACIEQGSGAQPCISSKSHIQSLLQILSQNKACMPSAPSMTLLMCNAIWIFMTATAAIVHCSKFCTSLANMHYSLNYDSTCCACENAANKATEAGYSVLHVVRLSRAEMGTVHGDVDQDLVPNAVIQQHSCSDSWQHHA